MNKTRFDDLPDTTLLSFKEAAEFLGITERYVSALEIRGKLRVLPEISSLRVARL